jgi:hypothetical protein
MSQFSEARTYRDLLHLFDRLGAQLNASRDALPYPDIDARHVGLHGMELVIAGYAMGFSSMIKNRAKAEIIASWGETNLDSEKARGIIEDAWKLGLLAIFHFRLDALFQNILRALGQNKRRPRFGDMIAIILDVAQTSDRVHAHETLLLLSYLRNSLHNNGIHRGKELRVKLLDMEYDLKENGVVDCASWNHVLAAISETINLLDEILASPAITALPVPIPDDYALNPST